MIAVTGAAGKTGCAVIKSLTKEGFPVRALIKRESQRKIVQKAGARNVLVGDMRDVAAWTKLLMDVEALYLIIPNMCPVELDIACIAINVAKLSKLRRFVYHSVLHPHVEAMPHHWQKMRVEEALFESGLNYTVLQPAAYMQNLLASWRSIIENGKYLIPYSADTVMGMVDLRDLAEVATIVLGQGGHHCALYELGGPKNMRHSVIADKLSQHIGKSVIIEQVPIGEWELQARANGLSEYKVNALVKMFEYYDQFGFPSNPNVLEFLLGRPATSFDTFVKDHLATTATNLESDNYAPK